MLRLAIDQQRELRENADSHADDIEQDAGSCFSTLSMLGERARYMNEAETREAYDEEIIGIVEGDSPDMLRAMDAIVLDHGMGIVDRITAEIGWHNGTDVVAALAMAVTLDSHAAIEDAERDLMLVISAWTPSDAPMPLNAAWLAPGIRWEPRGVLLEMPETLALAAIGRPLSAIITHPVLDRHALTITGVSAAAGGRTLLETDADRTPLRPDALIAMRPARSTTTGAG